jgi:hypothetical protein
MVIFVGSETIGIEFPQSLDCSGEVGASIGCVRGWQVKSQWSWSIVREK